MNTKHLTPIFLFLLLVLAPGASASSAACLAQNSLSLDSAEVAAQGIRDCLEGRVPCQSTDSTLKVDGLDEGVGSIQFLFQDENATTKTLVGLGSPDTAGSEPGVILRVINLPRETTMGAALRFFYELHGAAALPCAWTSDDQPLGQFLGGRVVEASCDATARCVIRFVSDAHKNYWIVANADSYFATRYLDHGSVSWLEGRLIRTNLAALSAIQDDQELKALGSFAGGAYRLSELISFEVLP